jgi:predicted nucleic acid-binding Zn ribbon protein
VRRRGPRPVGHALDALTSAITPGTLLAEVQRVWLHAAGDFAHHTVPVSERGGEVTVACGEAVRAQELDLMSELVVENVNEALGRPAVRRLRVQARGVSERTR